MMVPHEQKIRLAIQQKQQDLESRRRFEDSQQLGTSTMMRQPSLNVPNHAIYMTASSHSNGSFALTDPNGGSPGGNTSLGRKIVKAIKREQTVPRSMGIGGRGGRPEIRAQVSELFVEHHEKVEGRMDHTVSQLIA